MSEWKKCPFTSGWKVFSFTDFESLISSQLRPPRCSKLLLGLILTGSCSFNPFFLGFVWPCWFSNFVALTPNFQLSKFKLFQTFEYFKFIDKINLMFAELFGAKWKGRFWKKITSSTHEKCISRSLDHLTATQEQKEAFLPSCPPALGKKSFFLFLLCC